MPAYAGMTDERKRVVCKIFFNSVIFHRWIPVFTGMTILLFIPMAFAQGLFQESYNSMNTDEQLEPYSNPIIIRNRQAVMDTNQLSRSVSDNKSLTLNLFADAEFRAQVKNSKSLPTGASFMSGSLENGGHITLFISKEGIIRGKIYSSRGTYSVRSIKGNENANSIATGKQEVIIKQVDVSQLSLKDDVMKNPHIDTENLHNHQEDSMNSNSGAAHSVRGNSVVGAAQFFLQNLPDEKVQKIQQRLEMGVQTDEEELSLDKTVDVLIVYTPKAEAKEGGKEEIEATIAAEIEEMNQILTDSGLSHRKIRLMGIKKVNYTESNTYMSEDLQYLREKREDLITLIRKEYWMKYMS